jgi:hypothetical protein
MQAYLFDKPASFLPISLLVNGDLLIIRFIFFSFLGCFFRFFLIFAQSPTEALKSIFRSFPSKVLRLNLKFSAISLFYFFTRRKEFTDEGQQNTQ